MNKPVFSSFEDAVQHLFEFVSKTGGHNKKPKGFAGECGKISEFYLPEVKQMFGNDFCIAIGWVDFNGVRLFEDINLTDGKRHQGDPTLRFVYHAWIFNRKNGVVFDCTLLDTLKDKDDFDVSQIPDGITFIGPKEAHENNINYHPIYCVESMNEIHDLV